MTRFDQTVLPSCVQVTAARRTACAAGSWKSNDGIVAASARPGSPIQIHNMLWRSTTGYARTTAAWGMPWSPCGLKTQRPRASNRRPW